MCWLASRSQNEWISNWVFSPENWWSGSRSICRRSACSDSQGNYTFVALAPQISIRFRNSHHCPREIKFHIIVKLKRELTDLLKQVHIYHADVRMKSLWSSKHKEILSFGCGETHWEFAWETVVKEFKRQLHIAGCGKSLITILGREEKNEKKKERRNWRIAG